MQEGSSSRVKEDYSGRPGNDSKEPGPIKPIEKNYGKPPEEDKPGTLGGAKVKYEIDIKPDKNGRLKF